MLKKYWNLLNNLNDVSSDQSNTIIFAVPLEILDAIKGLAAKIGAENTKM